MRRLRLTPARIWDAPALAKILRDFGEGSDWLPESRSRLEETRLIRALIRRGAVQVARIGRRPVGFLAATDGEVQGLYLRPEARGQGVAQALVASLQTREDHIGLWAHAANHAARRFYLAQGFRPVRIGDGNDEGLTEIRYEWERVA